MTEKERTERLARAQAQKDAIRAARKTAQLARLLWPRDAEDELHGKVEVLTSRLRRAGQEAAAQTVTRDAHNVAWRKHKHLYHISDAGDVTQADWWRHAWTVQQAETPMVRIARQALRTADITGASDATLRLIDAAYWAAKDTLDEIEDAQGEIPCIDNDDVLFLFHQMEEVKERLQDAKDELVTWAEAHNYTITR